MSEHSQILDGRRLEKGGGSRLVVDGRPFLNFAGCNYLALGELKELRDAAQAVLDNGAPFSKYLVKSYGGDDAPFDEVEKEAAAYFGTEAAVYLPSGYHIGFAGLAGLAPYYDAIWIDELGHWCLADAAALSGKPVRRFPHRDVGSLSELLAERPRGERPLILTDGAFATTGAIPRLDEYAALAARHDGRVFVDESHAVGVVGVSGRGTADHYSAPERVHIGATLSKGLCGHGAVYVGTAEEIDRARAATQLRGSSPGSPISAAVSAAALRYARANPERRHSLNKLTSALRKNLLGLGLEIIESPTSIVSFALGGFEVMRSLQQYLFNDGIYVLHSNYIAAGPGGMIRLSVFADHTPDDVDCLVSKIRMFTQN